MSLLEIFFLSAVLVFAVLLFLIILVFWNASPYPDLKRSSGEKVFYDGTSKKKSSQFPSITDPFSVHLSVIVPAYNEEERLRPMLEESISFLEKRQNDLKKKDKTFNYEIIVVSDGSKDRTVDFALEYSDKYGDNKIRVLALEKNRGKGGAVSLGTLSSRGAVILFADADGATLFSDIEKLEESLEKTLKIDYLSLPEKVANEMALVVGSRAHLEEEALATRSIFRTFLMHGFHFLVWSLAVRTIRDTQCGFKMFTRRTAEVLFSSIHVQRWAFDVELLYLAEKFNIPMTEIPVKWTEIDGSKIIPVFSWLQMGKDLILIWLRYQIGAWKIAHKP